MRKQSVVEQYSLFADIPTNRDEMIARMAFRHEAAMNLVAERLANGPSVAVVASKEEKATEKRAVKEGAVARREAAKALKAVEAEKMRLAVMEKWAAWQPACMGPTVVVSSLVLIGGVL